MMLPAVMNVPSTVRVRISSEAAESISLSPVVVQEMKIEELIGAIVSAAGKDAARVRETLQRGTQVVGASRYRWERLEMDAVEVERLLSPFPDPDPGRPFNSAHCSRLILRGQASQISIHADDARKRRLFRSRSFWDEIAGLTQNVTYAGYSYKECADIYRLTLDLAQQNHVRSAARLSPFSSLARQIETASLDSIEFFVKR